MTDVMQDTDSFKGKRIVVTRARPQAAPLESLIRDLGGYPVSYPCIAIEAPADSRPLATQLGALHEYDWLVVTSRNVVDALINQLGAALDVSRVKVAAVGPATSAELQQRLEINCDFTPATASAEALARDLPLARACRILMPQSNLAENAAPVILRARGADVTTVTAYKTVKGAGGADLPTMLAHGEIDALTFMSPSAATFFQQRCTSPVALNLPAACIGQATAKAASELGFQRVITPLEHSLRGMLSALSDHFVATADKS